MAHVEEFSKELEKRDDVIASIGKSLGLKAFGWKRLIAREWLWCICTVGAAFIAGVIVYNVTTGYGRDDNAIIAFIVLIGLVYISRLTLWAIRQTSRKLPGFYCE